MLTHQERAVDNLAHAQWRVHFIQSLLDLHRATPRNGREWYRLEAHYVKLLEEAMVERGKLERGRVSRIPECAL